MIDSPWSKPFRLAEIAGLAAGKRLPNRLVADEAERALIARHLDVQALEALEADLEVGPWFDGLQIDGRWLARIVQICGVSLDPFPTDLAGEFTVRVVPAGSDLAPHEDIEVIVDPDADDPPDVLEGEAVDLGGYVVEHLALEIDPYPRKPGADFVAPAATRESSPFDVLRSLKGGEPAD